MIITSILSGSSQNFVWEEPPRDFGDPILGMIVPYKVEFPYSSGWHLSEHYAEVEESISPATQSNLHVH